mgnify:CR=1 FL=1
MAPPGCHGESRASGANGLGLVAEMLLCRPRDSESHTRSPDIRVICISRRGHQAASIKVPRSTSQRVVGAGGVEIIHAPFPDIATEVEESVFVGGKRTDRRSKFEVIHLEGLVEVPDALAWRIAGTPRIAGLLLAALGGGFLAFVREPDGRAPLEVGEQAVKLILGHEPRFALLGGEPEAKINPVMPTDIHNRVIGIRRIFLVGKLDALFHTVEPVVAHSGGPNAGKGLESRDLDQRHPNAIDMRIRNRSLRHRGRLNRTPFVIQLCKGCQETAPISNLGHAQILQVGIRKIPQDSVIYAFV